MRALLCPPAIDLFTRWRALAGAKRKKFRNAESAAVFECHWIDAEISGANDAKDRKTEPASPA
jgi:hypothetical protein